MPALVSSRRALLKSVKTYNLVSRRNPTASDDTTRGYAVGDTWVNTLTGAVYAATSVTAGAAVWAVQTVGVYPLDAIGS